MIFSDLTENNITHAVVIAHGFVRGISGYNITDYFILAIGPRRILADLGFRLNKRRIMSRTMSEDEILSFRGISGDYKLVCASGDGKVYEQPNNSFKALYDSQAKTTHTGREGVRIEKRPLPLSKLQYKPNQTVGKTKV